MAFESMISPVIMKKYLELWITEDTPTFDLSSFSLGSEEICAHIEIKGKCILAGLPFVDAIFNYFDCVVEWKYAEGSVIENKTIVAEVRGRCYKLLQAERTALNILSRASGVATIAKRVITKVSSKWKGQVSALHKISPGMKIVEKYAMYIGGMVAQGYDFSSMVVLNDKSIKAYGNIELAMKMIKEILGCILTIEVICCSKEEAFAAVAAGVDVVMLESFKSQEVKTISKQIKDSNPSVLVGVSGGITENNILEYAIANVDIISTNIFSQGYRSIDLSLNIISDNLSFIPEKIETVKDVMVPIAVEVVDNDINGMASAFVEPVIEVKVTPKLAVKRKLDETSIATEDSKIATPALENSTEENKIVEEKITAALSPEAKSLPKTEKPATKNLKLNNNNSNNSRDANTDGKKGNCSVYNMKSLGSARMPGQPVNTQTAVIRGRNGNSSTIFRSMAVGLSMTFPGQQHVNETAALFNRGAGNVMPRNSMHSSIDRRMGPLYRPSSLPSSAFCKHCNYQNPTNGPPFCRICRKMLF